MKVYIRVVVSKIHDNTKE